MFEQMIAFAVAGTKQTGRRPTAGLCNIHALTGSSSSRHRRSQGLLPLKQVSLRLSQQNISPVHRLLTPLDELLRRFSHLPRSLSHLGGQRHAVEEMGADGLGQIASASRAQVRPASQRIGGEFPEREAEVTSRTVGDDVRRAVHEHQCPLFWAQDIGPFAVNMRQMAVR